MATLVKERPARTASKNPFVATQDMVVPLDSQVPTPFPALARTRQRDLAQELLDEIEPLDVAGATAVETTVSAEDVKQRQQQRDMAASMTHVKQSCIMTLNGLLSGSSSDEWQPIVATNRRHSMPTGSVGESSSQMAQASTSTVASLETLVSNLRSHDPLDGMVQIAGSDDEPALVSELQRRVDGRLPTLSPTDAQLARALVSALAHLARLSQLHTAVDGQDGHAIESPASAHADTSIYDTLKRQVTDFQSRRIDQSSSSAPALPTTAVETTLLWSRIDEDLDTVLHLSRERHESLLAVPPRAWSPLPPEYEHPDDAELDAYDYPPEYKYDDTKSIRSVATRMTASTTGPLSAADEKMRMDLESVALAIDRLYLVAPQLHNQRVELKTAKLEQIERARSAGPSTSTTAPHVSDRQKQKMRANDEPDPRELDKLLGMIGRASARKMTDQVVVMDEDMKARMDRARQTNMTKRDAFVEQLIQHSSAGRMHSQDAVLSGSKTKERDPQAMLSLPEFIREPIPAIIVEQELNNPETMLTLPEFVRESALQRSKLEQSPPQASPSKLPESSGTVTPNKSSTTLRRLQKTLSRSRSRSLSAPPLAWLAATGNKASQQAATSPETKPEVPVTAGLSVTYVAEYQETLKTLYAFLRVDGLVPGNDVEAKVIASGSANGIERLLLKCGTNWSRPLRLPVHVATGNQEVRVQSGHYEINLPVVVASRPAPLESKALLDTDQIVALAPTAFVCNSCSLPLVQNGKITRWNDLPSEHWAELLDAWMCHHDQKLTDQAAKAAHGFWPVEGQALVGGSYILFDASAVVVTNVKATSSAATSLRNDKDEWEIVRCLCGAVIGRCQPSKSGPARSPFDDQAPPEPSLTYRIAKYSLRPIVPSNDVIRMPLSAYVVQDMHELAQAHAVWRFIVLDEEEEKPRLLLWMLKPHMLVSYETNKHYLLKRTATLHVAKILYRLVKPTIPTPDIKSLIEQYPTFAQHEQLVYPFQVCQQIAALLQESNTVYPEHTQELLGLRVGWLQRA
ncbi:HECT-like ubiquitin-conjugating enzyme-binding-domain-containing protein [Auriculariales sp. MPI-PUGE-AT-0066]|nr:HECT-like ubiquitin-conjugating enzyme-binding-domain-containing protein [Auriculariales sp. MPI-PUGE-AT-0066]